MAVVVVVVVAVDVPEHLRALRPRGSGIIHITAGSHFRNITRVPRGGDSDRCGSGGCLFASTSATASASASASASVVAGLKLIVSRAHRTMLV